MIRFIERSSWILFSILFLAGCGTINDFLQTSPSASLIGTWRPQNSSGAPAKLSFLRDGTYEFDVNGDGLVDVGGRYDILFNKQVKLQDEDGEITPDCIEPAVYKFRIGAKGLKFYLLGDQCWARAVLFRQTWVKAYSY